MTVEKRHGRAIGQLDGIADPAVENESSVIFGLGSAGCRSETPHIPPAGVSVSSHAGMEEQCATGGGTSGESSSA